MFGYVTVDKSEMRFKDFETYKAVYCSLCKQLGKDYSIFTRFILNYDCTFFALLLLSQKESCDGFSVGRCKFNPLKKCSYLKADEDVLSLAAALSVITAYFKLVDNISDSGFFTRIGCYMLLPFFSLWRKKAMRRYPHIDSAVKKMSDDQSVVEKDENCIIDKASDPTATMLSTILSSSDSDNDEIKTVYRNLGYYLGKWIYLIDAVNDYEEDKKHSNFNPYIILYKNDVKSHLDDIEKSLNHCLSQVYLSYNFLEPKRFSDIIENILTRGLPKKQKSVLYSKNNKTTE